MKKQYFGVGLLIPVVLVVAFLASIAPEAHAATPTLSAYSTGSGDTVQITVNGDPNAGVLMNYQSITAGSMISALGTTNSAGYFSTSLSTASYNITTGSQFSVTVNGQTSQAMTWPYQAGTTGSFSYSQNNLSMTAGQSISVTANNSYTGGLYMSSNSSPTVANVAISNNQVTVYANTIGSTSINLCSVSNTSYCAILYVSVVGSGNSLSLSQTSASLTSGQSVSITVGGGSGSYTVTGNTNSSLLQAYMSGSSLVLYANSGTGNSTVTVCSTGTSNCGVISVTIGSSSSSNSLNFSQTSASLNINQSQTITISGGIGAYYLSSNSNQTAVQAGVSGSYLNLYGNSAGTATIIVCSTGYGCGTVTATTNASGGSYPTLSQSSINLAAGQSTSVAITGSGSYYISSNSNPLMASASISGNSVYVNAIAAGNTVISVCQTGGSCASLQVTVTSGSTTTGSSLNFTNIVSVGQGVNLLISGGSSPYTISSAANSYFSGSLSGNILTIIGKSAGSSAINVCASNGVCSLTNVTVVGTGGTTPPATSSRYKFYNPLTFGAKGEEVRELQKRLLEEGVFAGQVTGYYGDMTIAAVKAYQTRNGLSALGNLGPATRALLNK